MFGLVRESLNQKYLEEYVSTYGCVSEGQLDRIMENAGFGMTKRKRYLSAIRTYSDVNYDKDTATYYSSSYIEAGGHREHALSLAQWVLIDFLGKIEHHFKPSSDFNLTLICMMLESRSYEIVFAAKGNEQYLDSQMRADRMEMLLRAEDTFFKPIVEKDTKTEIEAMRYIVLVEDISQAHLIKSKQIAYFCSLGEDNVPIFYEPEDIYKAH